MTEEETKERIKQIDTELKKLYSQTRMSRKLDFGYTSIFFLSVPNFSAHRNELIVPSCVQPWNQNLISMSCKGETNRSKISQQQPPT